MTEQSAAPHNLPPAPTPSPHMPASNGDPFSREWIARLPLSDAELCRSAPAVWLEKYGCVATGRHDIVRAILPDWRRFTSTAKPCDDPFSLVPPVLVTEDPPEHTEVRKALMPFFAPTALAQYNAAFAQEADRVVTEALDRGSVDVVTDIAARFVLKVFPDMLGLHDEGRKLILDFGDAAFNTVGPINEIFQTSFERAAPAFAWIEQHTTRDAVRPGGLASRILDLGSDGTIAMERAELLVRATIAAGFDTTVLVIANAIGALLAFPEQWDRLRADPQLARGLLEETLRYDPPARVQGRTATEDCEISGVQFRRGDPVALFLTAAGRDPIKWDEPDRFDITRKGANLGFGAGIHLCLGQALARMEFSAIIDAILRHVAVIEPAGEGLRFINNAAVGWAHLPIRLKPV
ncbi:cytochrome P450 [Altererythrobacter xixiisoli]|uniref:Cytochrome P450 n=1 Tax=Croceibacterium xixiisoli TaxID=1476466 RepID=A0A6I4TR28_9SPHN|nr:cytochrome P450 [Croceibacterium xixiisoli]MXO98334.1 cytochrome P450 [Croceibacterium xixiisoli]